MPTFSHTRLSAYENCPLQYKYRYIDHIKIEPVLETVEAFMGKRVHESLEKLYRDVMINKQVSKEGLLDFYSNAWDNEWTDEVRIVRKEYSGDDYRKVGVQCLSDYYDSHSPFNGEKTIAVEKKVLVRLGGDYYLNGMVDRLALRKGTYVVHDYKTGGHLPTQAEVDSDRQLSFYQLAVHQMWRDAEDVELVWHYLRFNKDLVSRRSEVALDLVRFEAVELMKKVEAAKEGDDFPARPSELCNWCEYRSICPQWTHLAKTELMAKNEFAGEPGVKLVNELTAVKNQVRQLEEKQEKIEQALIDYSEKEGADVIRGTSTKASITRSEHLTFPNKGSKDRARLEELLKQAGLWDLASTLDTHALGKLLEEKKIENAQEILSLSSKQQRLTIRLSKLKEEKESD